MFSIDGKPLTTANGEWFWPSSTATTNGWWPYRRPRNANWLFAIVVGGGGGGGAGWPRTAGSAGGGGGGGACGSITRILVAWDRLPDTIFLNAGASVGGSTAGNSSSIAVVPGTATQANLIAFAANGGGGTNGSASAGGSGGGGGSVMSASGAIFANLGEWTSIAGQGGITGGAQTGANGNSPTWGAVGTTLSAGAGGAGCTTTDFAGGNITGAGIVDTRLGGQNPGDNGAHGLWLPKLLIGTGGSGGASNNSGSGGKGGDGAPGCGGGGSGAGTNTFEGGRGGSGFIILWNF